MAHAVRTLGVRLRFTLRAAACLTALPLPASPGAEPAPAAAAVAPPALRAADLIRDPARLLSWLEAHSAEVAAAGARTAQARAELGQSRLLPNPVLDFGVGDIVVGRSNPPGLHFSDTSIYTVGVTQLIEIGKRGPRIESARLRDESARETFIGTAAQNAADARKALGRAVYLRARQAALEENLEAARKVVGLERSRVEHGDISRNDFDRLLLDTTAFEIDVSRNRAEAEGSLGALRSVLYGTPDLDGARLEDLDEAPLVPRDLPVAAALEDRADIQALRLSEEAAREDEVAARRKAIPDLDLRFGYTHDNLTISGDQEDTISFTLSIPFPLFDRGQHEAAKAAARADEMRETFRKTVTAARSELEELRRRKAFIDDSLERDLRDAVPRSAEVLDATQKAFDRGGVSMTELILARRTHLALLLNLMDLRFESFSVRNELRRVLGLDEGGARSPALPGDPAQPK